MSARLRAWLAAALTMAALSCSDLPEIPAGVCGNGVLESDEDCDGFAREGLACREPGSVGQCHMDCSPASDGARIACPDGWGCDPAGVCREATGAFVAVPEPVLGNAWALASADFDGDGRADVLATERPTAYGLTKVRTHYFDREAALASTFAMRHLISTPAPFQMPDGPRSALLFAGGGVGLLSGERDRTLIPEALPSYFVPGTQLRMLMLSENRINDSTVLVVITELDGKPGLYRQSKNTQVIERAIDLPGRLDELAAEPFAAELMEDELRYPCREVALAFRGRRELSLYSLCQLEGLLGTLGYRDEPAVLTLPLEPPAELSAGLLALDLDGDGHLDLLAGTDRGPYAAYGDGAGFGALQPHPLRDLEGTPIDMPIAGGDLSGDRMADLVLPQGVLRADASRGRREPRYHPMVAKVGAPWTKALIADFNRDDSPDLVAASDQGVDIDFFNGTRSSALNPFAIPTDRPIDQLASGDLDGDRIRDLVFVQRAAGAETEEEVSIAFGQLSGAPADLHTAAKLRNVQQLEVFVSGPETTLANLGIIYDQLDERQQIGSAIALFGGSAERSLPSVLELTGFSEDGSLDTSSALAATAGAFVEEGRADVIALTVLDSLESGRYSLWLLPDIASRLGNSARLGWDLHPDLKVLVDVDGLPRLAVHLGAGDLDGDGVDELVVAGPDASGERCLLTAVRITPTAEQRLQPAPALDLPRACAEQARLALADLDGDDHDDVLLLTGSGSEQALAVLWSDGSTRLADAAHAELGDAQLAPRAFVPFRPVPDAPLAIAYLTDDQVRLLKPSKQDARAFEDSGPIATVALGSGITAADIDGDGVTDLAVADSGQVRVLRAELSGR